MAQIKAQRTWCTNICAIRTRKIRPLSNGAGKSWVYVCVTLWWSLWRYDNEAISESDDDDKPWRIKRRSPPPQKTQLYSEPCPFRINCKFGLKCHNKHTEDEKRFFRTNQGEGNPLRKVKPCLFHPNCKKEMKECHYAHGEEDAWCLSCRDMCGHYTQNCPQLKKSQDDD